MILKLINMTQTFTQLNCLFFGNGTIDCGLYFVNGRLAVFS